MLLPVLAAILSLPFPKKKSKKAAPTRRRASGKNSGPRASHAARPRARSAGAYRGPTHLGEIGRHIEREF